MRDGTVLSADVWRPAGGEDCPVLLQRLPYDRTDPSVAVAQAGLDPLRAVDAGYAVVIQDCRGRFGSEGRFEPFSNEARDGADTVAWCAALPFSSGAVGMYGQSYFGATQLLAATERPPALRAIAPALTGSEYFEGWTYRGGVLELGFVLFWTLFSLAGAEIERLPNGTQASLREALDRRLADPWSTFAALPVDRLDDLAPVVPFVAEWLSHADRDEFWRAIAPNERYGAIATPALHIGGWFDPFLSGTLENFARLRREAGDARARDNQRLVIGPWSHACLGDTIGDRYFGPTASQAATDWTALHLSWFDRHLRGVGPADAGPVVRFFLMGADRWVDAGAWPPEGTRVERWFLHGRGAANSRHGDGVLSRDACDLDEPVDSFTYDPADPVPTAGGATFLPGIFVAAQAGPRDQRHVEDRRDVLVYTSEPLAGDLDVVGAVRVTLAASSSSQETDFSAKLVDVHPDGRALLVCDGIRAVVAPDPGQALEVDLGATAIRFLAGHRIRLEVSSSNFPRFARHPNTTVPRLQASPAEMVPALQHVHHDAEHPSFLSLPVWPSAAAGGA
ncbi:Cocaine esterase [Capillimicrobium parvum]|uniref:Cocaine esterase n=2 Tax=Capillimicrobium parvum TaxID=2884022 RepID=A0A9E7BZ39_9ACTN|nr:Cocaine esterase [Capillimicrobium parvum]